MSGYAVDGAVPASPNALFWAIGREASDEDLRLFIKPRYGSLWAAARNTVVWSAKSVHGCRTSRARRGPVREAADAQDR
jgi:hypothetical protein